MTDNPIKLFDQFIVDHVDKSLHGHFLDSDDNQAERIRTAIREARHSVILSYYEEKERADGFAEKYRNLVDFVEGEFMRNVEDAQVESRLRHDLTDIDLGIY